MVVYVVLGGVPAGREAEEEGEEEFDDCPGEAGICCRGHAFESFAAADKELG